jgi:hypothetical protein
MIMKFNHLTIAILVYFVLLLSACSNNSTIQAEKNEREFPPDLTGVVEVNNREYKMERGGYIWERKQGLNTEVVQTDAASPYQIAENYEAIAVKPNEKIHIAVEENPHLTAYLWNENGPEDEMELDENQLTVSIDKGKYIYEIIATWPNGEYSYTFVVEVQ